jgi:hypothetical protein
VPFIKGERYVDPSDTLIINLIIIIACHPVPRNFIQEAPGEPRNFHMSPPPPPTGPSSPFPGHVRCASTGQTRHYHSQAHTHREGRRQGGPRGAGLPPPPAAAAAAAIKPPCPGASRRFHHWFVAGWSWGSAWGRPWRTPGGTWCSALGWGSG